MKRFLFLLPLLLCGTLFGASAFKDLTLVDQTHNTRVPFVSGIVLNTTSVYYVEANPDPATVVQGAQFVLDGVIGSSDTTFPFDSNPGRVTKGSHSMSAQAFYKVRKKYYAGSTITVSFTASDLTPSPTPQPTNTPAPSPTPTASVSPTVSPTASPIPTATASPTATATPTPTTVKLVVGQSVTDPTTGTIGFQGVDLVDGATFDRASGNSIVAVAPGTLSTRWSLDGVVSVDNDDPFTLAGDSSGDVYFAWTPPTGDHVIVATAFTGLDATGTASAPVTVHVHVIDSATPTPTPTPSPTPTPTATPVLVPFAPSNVLAVANSPTKVTLTWKDNSTNEDGFRIGRSADNVTYTVLKDLPANTVSYVDTTVAANKKYYYRVRAHDVAGYSLSSNIASVTTPAVSPTPTPSGTPNPTPTPSPTATPTPPVLASVPFAWTPPGNLTDVAKYRMHWTGQINKVTDPSGGVAYTYNWTDQQDIPKTVTAVTINLPDTTQRYFVIRSVGLDNAESMDSNVVGYPSPAP